MIRTKTLVSLAVALLFSCSVAALAGDTPRLTWLKAKCAVCHGEDGSGDTPEGHSRGVPDLRREAIQKLTDEQLANLIIAGHSRMPSFKVQLRREQVPLLVTYIRSLRRQ
jgi:mono/diheme cytochrome c family protein